MKLLYATENKSKICNMRHRLRGYDVEVVTPKELGLHIDVDECGRTPVENALLKARAYFEKAQMPTIAGDTGLYIDDIDDAEQPGLFVRRVNGRRLSDDEMIEYYSKLSAQKGGSLTGRYITGLALIDGGKESTTQIPDDDFIISGTPNTNREHRGNPLDVITINPLNGKYYNDCSLSELSKTADSFDKKCIEFLQKAHVICEKSCGAIVYTINKYRQIRYLLIEQAGGSHSFPKGHINTGETEQETAVREIAEETGLELSLLEGFRQSERYVSIKKPEVIRQVVYFLAEYGEQVPHIVSPDEVIDIKSLPLEEALSILEYENKKKILKEADRFIKEHME